VIRRSYIKLKIKDSVSEVEDRQEIQKRLRKKNAVAIKNEAGEILDVHVIDSLPDDAFIEFVTPDSKEGLDIYRHSTSHIMAHAVKDLFPEAKVTIGPSIEEGFYYDFDVDKAFTTEDLEKIEKRMAEIIAEDRPFVRKVLSSDEAIRFFEEKGESYKVELIRDIGDPEVSLYEEGGFADLCRGPHLPSTGQVKAYKLLSVAGAYWRGDEKNKMLQRIYGTAFPSEKELKKYLNFLEEVKKRDHRRLGKELDLFSISDDVGPGLILWHPKGALIRKTIEDFWRSEHLREDYQLLFTPHIAKLDLWNTSGHTEFYTENMYSPMEVEGQPYEIKPMNCPFHIDIYKCHIRSYRDMPVKYAELGTVYRFERSGVLHGLLRVRGFTQDDAHIFMREDQMEDEILKVLDFVLYILKTFGFESFDTYLSTRPEKYVGTDEHWERSTAALEAALRAKELPFEIDEGGGAFYGPKIDIKVKDSLGRSWQCSTIQVDFNLPERFDISYRGSDGAEHRPIMIHRALMGSLERFFGVLVEHYAGVFPLWLAPVQVSVITVAERHVPFAENLLKYLKENDIRVEANFDNEKMGYKVRQATVAKIPYAIIIGDKEMESGNITVRKRNGENLDPAPRETILQMFAEEIASKK